MSPENFTVHFTINLNICIFFQCIVCVFVWFIPIKRPRHILYWLGLNLANRGGFAGGSELRGRVVMMP